MSILQSVTELAILAVEADKMDKNESINPFSKSKEQKKNSYTIFL